MDTQRTSHRSARFAPLAQAGLAALVAGSLLTFSTIAFRTAFDGPATTAGVIVSTPRTAAAQPVVLPTPPRAAEQGQEIARVVSPDETEEAQVLGIRIERKAPPVDRPSSVTTKHERTITPKRAERPDAVAEDAHRPSPGKGHEKARGKGHHKDHDHDHDAAKSRGRSKGKKKH